MLARNGDTKKNWYRSERFYHTADGWWFSSRENTEEGPFDTMDEAEMELVLYLRQLNLSHLSLVKSQ